MVRGGDGWERSPGTVDLASPTRRSQGLFRRPENHVEDITSPSLESPFPSGMTSAGLSHRPAQAEGDVSSAFGCGKGQARSAVGGETVGGETVPWPWPWLGNRLLQTGPSQALRAALSALEAAASPGSDILPFAILTGWRQRRPLPPPRRCPWPEAQTASCTFATLNTEPVTIWMKHGATMLSEISQTGKDKRRVISLRRGIEKGQSRRSRV